MHISAEGGQGDLQGVSMIGKSVIGSFSSDSLSCCTAVVGIVLARKIPCDM